MKMKLILQQPYPAYSDRLRQFLVCIVAGITVFCTLYLMTPFGMNHVSDEKRLFSSIIYSSITIVVVFMYSIVAPAFFPGIYREEQWVVYKEIINIGLIITTIAVFNTLAHDVLFDKGLSAKAWIRSIGLTLPVAAFPVSFAVLVKQKMLYSRYARQGKVWTEELHRENQAAIPEQEQTSLTEKIVLTGAGGADLVEFSVEAFRYIRAEDNYVKVYWVEGSEVRSALLRNTLKNLELSMKHVPAIQRCHRSYIVNLQSIQEVLGDAQGLKIKLADVSECIHVGKTYMDQIKASLASLR